MQNVVLVTPEGETIGHAPKRDVHSTTTPLHLAFSCHLFGTDGRLLVTRRSLAKRAWPGVWTNAFCGHPEPGEAVTAAVHRHAHAELGAQLEDVESVLPTFGYRAVDPAGIVEHELCPVFTARLHGDIVPDPAEVMGHRWVAPAALATALAAAPWAFSPWLVEQARELPFLAGADVPC